MRKWKKEESERWKTIKIITMRGFTFIIIIYIFVVAAFVVVVVVVVVIVLVDSWNEDILFNYDDFPFCSVIDWDGDDFLSSLATNNSSSSL